jgi:maltooligosyltrehalose trehalohydrolase
MLYAPAGQENSLEERGWRLSIGASIVGDGIVRFRVWGPAAETIDVKIRGAQIVALQKDRLGYFEGQVKGACAGDNYAYIINSITERPDPASRSQPDGVHGSSRVVDPEEFKWSDDEWTGIELYNYIIYELHVGAFTQEGTFESVISRVPYLIDLGITAIEIMPVAQFPGDRNWGYDGVCPFAPQSSYGGPTGLKRLVDACHAKGMAVILDVVYNHFGPEGNYLRDFSSWYFTGKYKTPWGDAINFDGPYSDHVRRYFIDNALYWIAEYHIDALRVDAVHGIFDFGAHHFLKELAEAVHAHGAQLRRKVYVVAESDLNDVRVINPPQRSGYGLDAQWNDDFHHALHALLTGERQGYYKDFGKTGQMKKALSDGFVYSGQYSPFRKRRHGSSSKSRPAGQLIVFLQNHDQVGNRALSERLSITQPLEKLKLAAGVVLLSPYIPLLFMGEEYGEKAPFRYFTSFSDKVLARAVWTGRQREFAEFESKGEIADPQDESAFLESKLHFFSDKTSDQTMLFKFYKELLRLRKTDPSLRQISKKHMRVKEFKKEKILSVRRWSNEEQVLCLYSFNKKVQQISLIPPGKWTRVLDSSSEIWGGAGSAAPEAISSDNSGHPLSLNPYSLAVYRKEGETLFSKTEAMHTKITEKNL